MAFKKQNCFVTFQVLTVTTLLLTGYFMTDKTTSFGGVPLSLGRDKNCKDSHPGNTVRCSRALVFHILHIWEYILVTTKHLYFVLF
jgi:hypothetical protein